MTAVNQYKCPECGKPTEVFFMGVRVCKKHCNMETMVKHLNRWSEIYKEQEKLRLNKI